MSNPPQLTADQRSAALDKAAEVRRQRAEVKHLLKLGSTTMGSLFTRAGDDDVVGKMKVLAVLESLPGVGKVKARRTMDDVGIAENRRIRGLGDQQRAALLKAFPGQDAR